MFPGGRFGERHWTRRCYWRHLGARSPRQIACPCVRRVRRLYLRSSPHAICHYHTEFPKSTAVMRSHTRVVVSYAAPRVAQHRLAASLTTVLCTWLCYEHSRDCGVRAAIGAILPPPTRSSTDEPGKSTDIRLPPRMCTRTRPPARTSRCRIPRPVRHLPAPHW